MANNARGEVDFKLGDRSFTGRADFNALCAIESEFNESVMSFMISLQDVTKVRLHKIVFVLHACIKAVEGKDAPALPEIGQLVVEDGIVHALQPMTELLKKGVNTLDDEEDEAAGK